MVIVLAARNSLDTIASSPYAALAVAVMLLALALDVLTVLIMFAGRLPFKGSIQNKVVLFVVGLGLVLLTAKLIYLG